MMRVKRADNYSVPIFATGFIHWNVLIEGKEGERPFCSVQFVDANPKHPDFAEYMQGVQERVEHVAAVLNAGFEALEKTA